MIVLDASVLIGHLDGRDPHHARAKALLEASGGEPLGASAITLAETLVAPARVGRLCAFASLTSTFPPAGRVDPAPGEEDLTTSGPSLWPFVAFGLDTLPSAQWAARSAVRAWLGDLPLSLGTTHEGGGGAGAEEPVKVAVTLRASDI